MNIYRFPLRQQNVILFLYFGILTCVLCEQGISRYFEKIEVNCTGRNTVWSLLAGRSECVARCYSDYRCWIAAYHHSTTNCTALSLKN